MVTHSFPLVSIIVRSMERDTLSATLLSIIASDYRPLELVLVNAKGGVVQLPSLPPHDLHLTLENQAGAALGRSAAANLGLAACQGSLALFLDDDDFIDTNHITRLASLLVAHPDAAAGYTGVRLVNREGIVVREQNEPWELARLQGMNFLPIHAVMFRLAYARTHASFDPDLPLMEDWDFWNQLAQQGLIIRLEGCSATYNIGLGESGLSENRDHSAMLTMHAKVLERLRQTDPLAPSRALFWFDTAVAHLQQEKRQQAANLDSANSYIVLLEQRVRQEEATSTALSLERTKLLEQHEQTKLDSTTWRMKLEQAQQRQLQYDEQILLINEQLKMLTHQLSQQEIELRTTRSELAIADATLSKMVASRSWRLTAPLRALAKTLRNLVNH